MPRDGDGAAFGFHALVDEIPVLIDAIVEFLDALEDVGKVERSEGGAKIEALFTASTVIWRMPCCTS